MPPPRDYCDKDGALELKSQVEHYWRERGYAVRVEVVEAKFHAAMRSCRFDLRSDLVDGLPGASADSVEA